MDCTEFRKYVGAFADGELEVQENLTALEHLNMCPDCVARVAEISHLKSALVREYGGIRAPAYLSNRIRLAFDSEVAETQVEHPADRDGRFGRLRVRLLVPLGMAAALVASVLLWQYRERDLPRHGTIAVVSERAAADIREQHVKCVRERGVNHHDEDLPRDLRAIASNLSLALDMEIIAPDLSTRGFDLVGADRCGIAGLRGAHVLYKAVPSQVPLSVFSVTRMHDLGCGSGGSGAAQYFVSSDEPLGVVAWQNEQQSYAICGRFPQATLLVLAGESRTASAARPGSVRNLGPTFAFALGRELY